jgi:hypothetical protein
MYLPPDTNGDVGPNHYVQQTNLLVRVWNKAGVPLTAPFRLSALFRTFGWTVRRSGQWHPIVLYDPLSDRWMLSQFAFASQTAVPYHQCIAISKTPDPTGAYFLYDFITVGFEFPITHTWSVARRLLHDGPSVHFRWTIQRDGGLRVQSSQDAYWRPHRELYLLQLECRESPGRNRWFAAFGCGRLNTTSTWKANTFVYFTTTDFGDPATGLRLFDFHADFNTPANSTFTERPESTLPLPWSWHHSAS